MQIISSISAVPMRVSALRMSEIVGSSGPTETKIVVEAQPLFDVSASGFLLRQSGGDRSSRYGSVSFELRQLKVVLDAVGWISRYKSVAGSRLVRRNPPQTRAASGLVIPMKSSGACGARPRAFTNDPA